MHTLRTILAAAAASAASVDAMRAWTRTVVASGDDLDPLALDLYDLYLRSREIAYRKMERCGCDADDRTGAAVRWRQNVERWPGYAA